MSTPESKVKSKVVTLLKQYGAYYIFPSTHGMGRSGVPDIIACVHGQFIAIECKAGDNEPTILQQRELAAITANGGASLVVNEKNIIVLASYLKLITGE